MTDLMTIDTFTEDQEQFMLDIVETKGNNLPAKIEDVIQVFEFTDFKAKAFKMMADKAKKLDEQSEIYHSALRSGQKWGIATLYSQKRMGEITRDMPKSKGRDIPIGGLKRDILQNQGLVQQRVSENENIANNPEILDRVIKNAEKRGEIPTKTAVLNTIRVEKYREKEAGKIIKHNERAVQKMPKAVKDYFNAISDYKDKLKIAFEVAKRGLFAPESINIISKKHEELRSMMNEIEELINEY